MAQEIELKLEIQRSIIGKVAELPWLRELATGPSKREKLVTVYFDTAKFKLHDRGLALRVRHSGKKRVQTIKVLRNDARGAFGRDEWEQPIADDRPDLSLARGTALEPVVTKRLRRKLRPIFETVVERTTLPVGLDGADVEIAVDRGYIRTGAHREPISEIELELKKGDRTALSRIAERLAGSIQVAYGARAKPERGYALSADKAGEPVAASEIALNPKSSTAEAFRAIALACLDHALSNERAVHGGDPEGIHQMRVGLRRLRAALSLFKELVRDAEFKPIKAELKWLTDRLGAARELNVLIAERVDSLRDAAPEPAMGILKEDLETRLDAELEQAGAVVASERYRAIGLRTALWILDGKWSSSDDELLAARRERPAAEFAAELLTQNRKKILKKAARIEQLDPERRHKLRIAIKKLRYACEFFANLFAGRKRDTRRKRFSKMLEDLQDALGTLNDMESHKRVAGQIVRSGKPSGRRVEKALAMGFIEGHEQTQVAHCLSAVEKAASRLAKAPLFWE
jgi:inorganic triphosphatase YgiF